MPHAELKYSSDMDFDVVAVLQDIERVINEIDPGSGECKGRGYPTDYYHHSHLIVMVTMLPKLHRTPEFVNKIMAALEAAVKARLSQDCEFSLGITLNAGAYMTGQHKA